MPETGNNNTTRQQCLNQKVRLTHTNFNIFGENKTCEELEEEMEAEERDRETHPLPSGPVDRQR